MTKDDFKKKVDEAGDAVITYKSLRSRKQKYNICTRDFSTKYIQEKKTRAKEDSSTVLLFCWDTDSYRLLKFRSVISILPLNKILKND
tara:strand:+ start:860 stop:1123 length:264 start_codon:yes stop_codon:yes gene_type:complete